MADVCCNPLWSRIFQCILRFVHVTTIRLKRQLTLLLSLKTQDVSYPVSIVGFRFKTWRTPTVFGRCISNIILIYLPPPKRTNICRGQVIFVGFKKVAYCVLFTREKCVSFPARSVSSVSVIPSSTWSSSNTTSTPFVNRVKRNKLCCLSITFVKTLPVHVTVYLCGLLRIV